MEPRILLLMDPFEAYAFRMGRHNPRKSYTLMTYSQDFAPKTVEAFLREHTEEFDAVAVSSFYRYDPVRQAMEGTYTGPKILIKDKPSDEQPNVPYTFTVDLMAPPAEFDKLVERHFRDMSQPQH